MSLLIRKKKSEPIRKVKVKMTCNCHATCICGCTNQAGFVTEHVTPEALESKRMHDNISVLSIN